MQVLHPSPERGATRTGWLDSRHSFSFGSWHRPDRAGFRTLRVLNEDRVEPASGFGPHPHRDMEILTVVLEGALEHRDSAGGGAVLRAGDVAYMRAGRGVVHSEWNPSDSEPVHFLQVWLHPARRGLPPHHESRRERFPAGPDAPPGAQVLAGPDVEEGADGALPLAQDARVHAGRAGPGAPLRFALAPGRGAWIQAVRGGIEANGTALAAGDGLAVEDEPAVAIRGEPEGDFLLFDLA